PASAAKANAANPRMNTTVRISVFLFMQKNLLVCIYFMAFFLTKTFFPNLWSCHAQGISQLVQSKSLVSMLDCAGEVHH
ncbi:MAG: hypothetical protein OEU80_01775, partial [Deltaproteobacteria bacterium]|nr:hypothetical protein [Deltaproteobacteria bacterium]